jgi:hypothetical protein
MKRWGGVGSSGGITPTVTVRFSRGRYVVASLLQLPVALNKIQVGKSGQVCDCGPVCRVGGGKGRERGRGWAADLRVFAFLIIINHNLPPDRSY